jgi:hypothetical protein
MGILGVFMELMATQGNIGMVFAYGNMRKGGRQ